MEMSLSPAVAGAIAGATHHFFFQYPNQAKLFTTFYAVILANTIFSMVLLGPKDAMRTISISRASKDFVIFNTTLVLDYLKTESNISVWLRLFSRLYITFILDTEGYRRNSGSVLQIGLSGITIK
jgi:hypothetical protein